MTSLGLLHYSEISDSSAINSNMTEIENKKQARHNITIKKKIKAGYLNTKKYDYRVNCFKYYNLINKLI